MPNECRVKKGEFKVGDLCIYFSLMSVLDEQNPYFDFLKDKGKMPPLKSKKMKGALSQGLVTPLELLKFYGGDPTAVHEGDDVTKLLKVRKYISPEEEHVYKSAEDSKDPAIPFPSYIPKTDEPRLQNEPKLLTALEGKEVVVTRKEDGTSATFVFFNGTYLVCSRNIVRKPTDKGFDPYMEAATKFGIEAKLKAYGKNIGVQGEIVGPQVSGNRLVLKELGFHVFNIWLIDERRYGSHEEIVAIAEQLKLDTVPLLYKGPFKAEWGSVDAMLKFAESIEYFKGGPAEGIVVKSNSPPPERRVSFKVISNAYLIKHKL